MRIDKLPMNSYYAQKEQAMQAVITISGLIFLAFVISVPCGYLRQSYKKYSFMWFMLIHLPIPFIVLARIETGLSWQIIPFTLSGSVAGQIVGGMVSRRRR